MKLEYLVPSLISKSVSVKDIVLDPKQQVAADTVPTGMNFSVSGPGGSGKTWAIVMTLMNAKNIQKYPTVYTQNDEYYRDLGCDPDHTYVNRGIPGVLFLSYTNPAVTVLRRNIPTQDLVMQYLDPVTGDNTVKSVQPSDLAMTVSKLLQFRPADPETASGLGISTGTFYPYRDEVNKLPPEITTIVLDEVGQLEIKLMLQLINAIDLNRVQLIFIGDICQTGASYGPSTLIRALIRLPRVSFDKVYRYSGALLELATEINNGEVKDLEGATLRRTSGEGDDREAANIGFFTPTEEKSVDAALARTTLALYKLITTGTMSLYTDMFMVPQKTQEMSGNIVMGNLYSQLDKLHGRPSFYLNTNDQPIILAVGDAIFYDNKVGMVLDIGKNEDYVGDGRQNPLYSPSRDVDTWCLVHDQTNQGTVDSIITRPNSDLISKKLDDEITKPLDPNESLDRLVEDLDMPKDMLDFSDMPDEEEDKKTQQLTNTMIVLNLTHIDNGFVTYKPASVDRVYKAFTKELLDNALLHHNSRQATEIETIQDSDWGWYQSLVSRLLLKYGINPDDIELKWMTRTSDLSSKGVKYNWRTVQQTQGSQAYSTFTCMHRKSHVAPLMFRENIYTAFSRSMANEFGVMSKGLFDGSANAGGINGQKYPGIKVIDKLKNFLKKNRTISQEEMELDKHFDKMLQINATRKAYYDAHGDNLLLARKAEEVDGREVVDQLDINLGGSNGQPF